VCRVKNKFALPKDELVGGYRDLMFCVLFEVPREREIEKEIERECLRERERE
jgi:hypothetical protein